MNMLSMSRYLCVLNPLKSDKSNSTLSNKIVNKLKSSINSNKTTNSDCSDDSSDSSKEKIASSRSVAFKPGAETDLNESESKSDKSKRTFNTLGENKPIKEKSKDEVILPLYPRTNRALSRSTNRLSEMSKQSPVSSLEESKEMEEDAESLRSRALSKSRINDSRGRSLSRSKHTTRSSESLSRGSFNKDGFREDGQLTAVGLPFDNSTYTRLDKKANDSQKMSTRRSFSRSAERLNSSGDIPTRRSFSKSAE